MYRSAQRLGFAIACAFAAPVLAFDSTSTGADGALAPNVDTEIQLPPSGILNYTSINIPAGVTVRFKRNALNTPATLLVRDDATILGAIDVSGKIAADSYGAGSGNTADDGLPGAGGPGGFIGGLGGKADIPGPRMPQAGIGPGGGKPSTEVQYYCYGSGGGFATAGSGHQSCSATTSATYGNPDLLPLVGGSGGAGGVGYGSTGGGGGGGGGGALLIAVSGTLRVTGSIVANGGRGGTVGHTASLGGAPGGGGSGGAIRLVATTLTGNGPITATGGGTGSWGTGGSQNTAGTGRIRLEAEIFTRTTTTDPAYSSGQPGALVVSGVPTIRIASVAGVASPADPTGSADIVLPTTTPNPVAVVIETSNVPLGTTVLVTLTPPTGVPVPSTSGALAGTLANATATASVNLVDGPSVLLASLSFTVSGGQQLAWASYTDGEAVVSVELAAGMTGAGTTTLVTASGRRVTL